ncbi:Protein S-acyltransferase 8 [Raphanus sativus]|nr:Protein S-acyltransferase 8 [Raphanus sativus]
MSALYIKILMDHQRGTVWMAMRESPWSVALMGIAYRFVVRWRAHGRANSRTVAYNRGCANNFMEVFARRAFVEEEQPPRGAVVTRQQRPTTRESAEDENGGRREKVEDDLDIGDDLMNISQRCNPAEGSNHGLDIDQSMLGVAERAATIRTETRHGSWGSGRSGSWV